MELVNKLPSALSPSSMGTFQTCPKQFYYDKIEKRPRKPAGDKAVMGTFVHAVLEAVLGLPEDQRNLRMAKEAAAKVWDTFPETEKDFSALELTNSSKIKFKKNSWKGIAGAFSMEDLTQIHVHSLEQFLTGYVGTVPFRGYVDAVVKEDDGLVVWDHKTGKFPFNTAWQEKPRNQISVYCALLEEMGLNIIRGELLYVTHRKRIVLDWTSEAKAAIVGAVESVWAEIIECCRTGEWEARENPLCGWCDHQSICPIWKDYEL